MLLIVTKNEKLEISTFFSLFYNGSLSRELDCEVHVYVILLSVILNETLIALISVPNVVSGMCARSSFFENNNKNASRF